ncbi:monooxygenase [Mycobacterium avium]|uniref:propane 2-monooxygenase n=1 Tax=Mycobacterium avium TaxID=1764 RepID=A0A2A2ZNY8_MYCAV|nr:monooxygenase [Mycobacterium avium subsp. hominissuis]PBA28070.1 monooxygenase [Mycobacterium avium]MCA4740460.1 monooxygenase [Mycobacterium avium subsp. hominissuis]MCA4744708.1 monooxygenase [Mycobacterium avium subsp. hominissuis]MCA4764281.1 monooxygenase [Mycobacterium avium subsp. hominissuis]
MMASTIRDVTVPERFYSPRDFTYITPSRRRLTEYEAVICNAQPDMNQFETGGWFLLRPDLKDSVDFSSTALRHPNWFAYRDPSGLWQRPYIKLQAQHERSIAQASEAATRNGSLLDIAPAWIDVLAPHYEAFASLEWGMFLAHAYVSREALSDTITMAFTFSGMDRLRHQQDIALYSLELHDQVGSYQEGLGMQAWLADEAWQPTRRLVERLLTLTDWAEIVTVINLVVDPMVTALIGSEFFRTVAPLHGDVITPVIEMTAEADRLRNLNATRELVKMVTADATKSGEPVPARENLHTLQGWIDSWCPMAAEALEAFVSLFERVPLGAGKAHAAQARVKTRTRDLLEQVGLRVPVEVGA